MIPRSLWTPEVGRLFGIRPWEMGSLTVSEVAAIREHLVEMSEAYDGA